jgi:hypothetical protein
MTSVGSQRHRKEIGEGYLLLISLPNSHITYVKRKDIPLQAWTDN